MLAFEKNTPTFLSEEVENAHLGVQGRRHAGRARGVGGDSPGLTDACPLPGLLQGVPLREAGAPGILWAVRAAGPAGGALCLAAVPSAVAAALPGRGGPSGRPGSSPRRRSWEEGWDLRCAAGRRGWCPVSQGTARRLGASSECRWLHLHSPVQKIKFKLFLLNTLVLG